MADVVSSDEDAPPSTQSGNVNPGLSLPSSSSRASLSQAVLKELLELRRALDKRDSPTRRAAKNGHGPFKAVPQPKGRPAQRNDLLVSTKNDLP